MSTGPEDITQAEQLLETGRAMIGRATRADPAELVLMAAQAQATIAVAKAIAATFAYPRLPLNAATKLAGLWAGVDR